MDPVAVSVAVALILITSLVCLCLRSGSKGRVVCLLGLSNSGKTLMFMRVTNGAYVRTQTSMKENKAPYQIVANDKKMSEIELVDIPGNERLRHRTLQQFIDALMGVIIVVDSVNFSQESRDLAHLMIDFLSEPRVHKRRFPILVACNKQDLLLARSADDIKETLESEITLLLTSESVKLSSLDKSKEQKRVQLISKNEEFKFPSFVCFVPCSARGKGDENNCTAEIEPVLTWINDLK